MYELWSETMFKKEFDGCFFCLRSQLVSYLPLYKVANMNPYFQGDITINITFLTIACIIKNTHIYILFYYIILFGDNFPRLRLTFIVSILQPELVNRFARFLKQIIIYTMAQI